ETEGTITANPETGVSIDQGRTLFSRQYYLLFRFMFLFNFIAQSADNGIVFMYVWIVIIVAFWYSLYRERNTLAHHIDELIMNDKSEKIMDSLVEQDSSNNWIESEEILQEESHS